MGDRESDREQNQERGDRDDMSSRVGRASGGEPAAGLEAEGGSPSQGRGEVSAADRPEPDEVTEADKEAQTREAERVQQSGEGIRGYGTGGREDYGSEEEIRRAAEEED